MPRPFNRRQALENRAFLPARPDTVNVRLSARAAGFAHSSFYRLRDHDSVLGGWRLKDWKGRR